jgi:molybdopterin synthase sulfur carrier subunit
LSQNFQRELLAGGSVIKVLYFAYLAETLGLGAENIAQEGFATAAELIEQLSQRGGQWQALKADNVLIAINQAMAKPGDSIADGDEVAFFPPVTGG